MTPTLASTIAQLSTPGKGILAADESMNTIANRFEPVNIASTESSRRAYRELLLTTPQINHYIAGVILHDETFHQRSSQSIPFPNVLNQNNILVGIKVDEGLIDLANTAHEKITRGLDHLSERLVTYAASGAHFAKWRAVYKISATTPSMLAMTENAAALARYAAYCQEQNIVPIVEPEILIDGEHTLAQCERATSAVLHILFEALYHHQVKLEYMVLKSSMVLSGKQCPQQASIDEVADATLRVLKQTVPAAVPSINFLSGGQTPQQATARLNAMNQRRPFAWNLSYSYARALQEDCLKCWKGLDTQREAAQQVFFKRLKLTSLAAVGQYAETMETVNVMA